RRRPARPRACRERVRSASGRRMRPGGPCRRQRQRCFANLSGGIETVISRGFGSNQVASANMAPKVRPPTTPTTVKNRNRLGIIATPCRHLGSTKEWKNYDQLCTRRDKARDPGYLGRAVPPVAG